MRHRFPLVTLLAASALACSEPIAPGSLAGTYVLARVGEVAMPGAFVNPMSGDTVRIAFDTLVLGADGAADLRAQIEIASPRAGGSFSYEERVTGRWQVEGRAIRIQPAGCAAGSICAAIALPSRELHLVGDQLVERNASVGAFVRVPVRTIPDA